MDDDLDRLTLAELVAEVKKLWVQPDLFDVEIVARGSVDAALVIPETPTLIGAIVHEQVVPIELTTLGSIAAVTATNRLTLTLGRF